MDLARADSQGLAGAEYCASGHEVFFDRPGAPNDTSYARVLFELPCPAKIPYTGGYRAVMPGAVRTGIGKQ